MADVTRARRPLTDRFWSKVDKSGECWLWTAHGNGKGYGFIQIGDKPTRAHRMAWELSFGPIPEGMWVLHRCDTPRCVRPDHLWLGTAADNNADMIAKGRANLSVLGGACLTLAQATHCPNGHLYTGALRTRSDGSQCRLCVTCRERQIQRSHAARRALR